MRKPAWIRRRVMRSPASWQRWLFILLTVSVLGTFVAGVTLIVDGWFDALALYVTCVLTLALLLSHFAKQQASLRTSPSINEGRVDSSDGPPSLVLTRAPGAWAGADQTTATAAFSATRMD